jgi:hypothetical protein
VQPSQIDELQATKCLERVILERGVVPFIGSRTERPPLDAEPIAAEIRNAGARQISQAILQLLPE